MSTVIKLDPSFLLVSINNLGENLGKTHIIDKWLKVQNNNEGQQAATQSCKMYSKKNLSFKHFNVNNFVLFFNFTVQRFAYFGI